MPESLVWRGHKNIIENYTKTITVHANTMDDGGRETSMIVNNIKI